MRKKIINLAFGALATLALGLAGCGGGGGTSATTPTETNTAPVANAGTTQNVVTGTVVTLDGSASSDANGDSLTYSWSITSKPAGSTITISSASVVKPTFTPTVAGSYVFGLAVNDGKLSSTTSTVTINAADPTTIGGILSTNTTLTKSQSPYKITSPLQIAYGSTLTIEPGVSIYNGQIQVFGKLNAIGRSDGFIYFNNVSISAGNEPRHEIVIQYANINGGSFLDGHGYDYGIVNIKDSIIRNVGTMKIKQPNLDSYVERSIFINTGALELYSSSANENIYLNNNVFINQTGISAIDIYYQYRGTIMLSHNTFTNINKTAIRLLGTVDKPIAASNNYWSTIDTNSINSMIFDKNDDLTSGGYVTYLPILTSPDPITPDATPYL